jgi:magnesium transporter
MKDFHPEKDEKVITWINIDGLEDIKLFEDIGERFSLHPLILEDILNTGQRPKMEDYGDYIYLVLKNF